MKVLHSIFSLTALSLLSTLVEGSCDDAKNNGQCKGISGCTWNGNSCVAASGTAQGPGPAPASPTPCSDRKGGNGGSCENGDGLCMKVKGKCQPVNGDGQESDSCMASLTADNDGDLIYAEVAGSGCAAGYVCNVANASDADSVDTNIQGFCEAEECLGKKVPGNCNGNNPNDPVCNSETERVTICHRTCSAKNPWVRITIDEDAWDGEGCGHKQHDIRDECKNKAPWTEWGVNRRDYLIKRHGTRAEVAEGKTKDEEKAYWKKWERACPYVRNGACCDWDDPENPCCGEAADVPAPTPAPMPGQCPFVTLDFTSIPNPMAEYYGQSSTFQAGDYLYDQLWWSHGVKVSARILYNSHANEDKPFIPKFVPGTGWVDDKINQDKDDPSSGGAVRLFDTMRPTASSTPEYDQPLCEDKHGEGDPDLGAPNQECRDGGPGIGEGGVEFDPDTNAINPYANCEPLGLICIIQEEDKDCPDDTGKGGYITFTFREPTEVALTSLLDIDEKGNSPKIFLYHGNGKTRFNTQPTGENGLYPLSIDTSTYKDVTMVDIKYWGSGSIESLQYRYCPETPTPQIEITKYAGPPGFCNETEVDSNMEDDLYTVPSDSDNWTYCYVIAIPASSEECLYNVKMQDPAPIGGTTSSIEVTTGDELLCPGEKKYIEGSSHPGSSAPEGAYDAFVVGKGYHSGQEVTDEDPAAVDIYEEIITPTPTDAPTKCPMDMGDTDSTLCPHTDAVTVLSLKSDNNRIIPDSLDPSSIFYDISFAGTDAAPEVEFKIDNPFDFDVDIYIQYHKKAEGSSKGALDPACEDRPFEPPCNPDAISTMAGCIHGHNNGGSFAPVTVFFVSEESIFGQGGDNITPYECCPIPEDDANKPIIEYTFKVLCECPTTSRQLLRRNI